jgi:hypothetical protein
MTGFRRVFEFFVFNVGASTVTRVKVLKPVLNWGSFMEECRWVGVWSRLSAIRYDVLKFFLAVAFSGGDDVISYWCPQVPSPPDEAQLATASLGNLRVSSPPSLSGRSWDYLLLIGTKLLRDSDLSRSWSLTSSGPHRRLPDRFFYKCMIFFKIYPIRGCYAEGLEAALSFAHGAPSRYAEGRWC